MAILAESVVPVKPVTVHPYFDRVALWLPERANKPFLAKLRPKCGSLHVGNDRARFDPKLVQRLELKQPKPQALRLLAGLPGAHLNQVEVALDLVFANSRERDRTYEFLAYHLVRRWHGKKQQIHIHHGKAETRYDAGRSASNSIVLYQEDHSRITGESDCLHVEWRALNQRAVRSAGIESARDLVGFDFRQFWKKQLLLLTVEPERLGRYFPRQGRKGRRRKSALDHRRGRILLNGVASIQELIDRYQVRRLLRPIANETLLPKRSEGENRVKSLRGQGFRGEWSVRRRILQKEASDVAKRLKRG
jgi:hypothetical protein